LEDNLKMKNILNVKSIEKYYGNKGNMTKAIDNISFSVEEGEFVGIMGPSGSGKTTLLNCISTIDTVSTGNIIINDKDITKLKSKALDNFRQNELGFIFQDFNLLDTLTAYENIALALTIKGEKISQIDSKIKEVVKYLEIEQVLQKYPYQMSGGQKQRVASARAIVTEPSLVLADEPTGALDSKSSRLLLERFEMLNQDLKTTILMVTHDAFTASYAYRILFIKDGKIFTELVRGKDSRKEFFNRIMEVVTLLGGDDNDVF
jgi:putative ABC transport system ATP-binding protein